MALWKVSQFFMSKHKRNTKKQPKKQKQKQKRTTKSKTKTKTKQKQNKNLKNGYIWILKIQRRNSNLNAFSNIIVLWFDTNW